MDVGSLSRAKRFLPDGIARMSTRSAPWSTSTNGSIPRQIAAIALPAVGQLVAEPAFILIGTAIVGHVDASALGKR